MRISRAHFRLDFVTCLLLLGCSGNHDRLEGSDFYLDVFDINRVSIQEKNSGESRYVVPPQVVRIYEFGGGAYVAEQKIVLTFDCINSDGMKTIRSISTDESRYWLIQKGVRESVFTYAELKTAYPKHSLTDPIREFPYYPDDGRARAAIGTMKSCEAI